VIYPSLAIFSRAAVARNAERIKPRAAAASSSVLMSLILTQLKRWGQGKRSSWPYRTEQKPNGITDEMLGVKLV
jgi:hypothetical protein